MADRIYYKPLDSPSGNEVNDLIFRNGLMPGIPSPPSRVVAVNESLSNTFVGEILVMPSEGQSYSEDVYVSRDDLGGSDDWTKQMPVQLPPQGEITLKTRIVPRSTPHGSRGTAIIDFRGTWQPL